MNGDEKKEKLKEYRRKYYLANRDKIIAKMKKWIEDNPERRQQWRDANKQRLSENSRRWDKEHQERKRELRRAYYKRNREAIGQRAAEYYANNNCYQEKRKESARRHHESTPREVQRAKAREYREANLEKVQQRKRAYREANREKVYQSIHERRARLRGSSGKYTVAEWRALKERFDHRCVCCGQKKKLTVDHVRPIALGGSNTIDNIQPLCLKCNTRKGIEWIDYRPGFSILVTVPGDVAFKVSEPTGSSR